MSLAKKQTSASWCKDQGLDFEQTEIESRELGVGEVQIKRLIMLIMIFFGRKKVSEEVTDNPAWART